MPHPRRLPAAAALLAACGGDPATAPSTTSVSARKIASALASLVNASKPGIAATKAKSPCASRIDAGVRTGIPRASAKACTGEGFSSCPRPLGAGGWE